MPAGWNAYDILDWSLHGLGLIALAILVASVWRDPRRLQLSGTAADLRREPELPALAVVVVAWLIGSISLPALLGGANQLAAASVGSPQWLHHQLGELGLKALLALLMVAIMIHAARQAAAETARIDDWLGEPLAAPPPPVRKFAPLRAVGVGIIVALALLPLCYSQLFLVNTIWNNLRPDATQPTHPALEALLRARSDPWTLFFLLVGPALVAPVIEELFFRGILLGSVRRSIRATWPAILLSSAAFGMVHSAIPTNVLPLASMGVVLGCLRVREGGMTACIVAHSLFNLRTLALAMIDPARIES